MNDLERKKLWDEYAHSFSAELREKIILEYAPLVKVVAGRLSMYLGGNVEYEDLCGYGIFGLIDAIDKFDLGKDVKFETYASLRIRGAILDQIRKMDWIPRTIRQKQKKIEQVMREIEASTGREATDEETKRIIIRYVKNSRKTSKLSVEEKKYLCIEIFNSIRGLDVLEEYLKDDSISEIMVNGYKNIFIERKGRLYKSDKVFDSAETLSDIIQKIVALANRTVNMASPIVDARLMDGSRVNVVLDPISLDGPALTIRRFPNVPMGVNELIMAGAVNEEIMEFLKKLVRAKYNILISGGTGSGKTTFLNIISGFIDETERIITIEDSAELKLMGIKNLVRLETRNSNMNSCSEITIRDLIKSALRMRPDRIIVGEVRGEEAIDMLQSMNVGIDGSLSTIHANSGHDALSRLEVMIMLNKDIPLKAIRRQIESGVDIIIQLSRLRDSSRKLISIEEVTGMKDDTIITSVLYRFTEDKISEDGDNTVRGYFEKVNDIQRDYKLRKAGFL